MEQFHKQLKFQSLAKYAFYHYPGDNWWIAAERFLLVSLVHRPGFFLSPVACHVENRGVFH